jgi:hypothetical protein
MRASGCTVAHDRSCGEKTTDGKHTEEPPHSLHGS